MGEQIDVWVADDGSPDGTGGRRAGGMAREFPGRVELLGAPRRTAAAPP